MNLLKQIIGYQSPPLEIIPGIMDVIKKVEEDYLRSKKDIVGKL